MLPVMLRLLTMTEKKITRKVITKVKTAKIEPAVKQEVKPVEEKQYINRSRKTCQFCQSKTTPCYTDMATLRRFTTDRAKILPKLKSNLCSKHQRVVTKHIKYARHLAILPFTPKV